MYFFAFDTCSCGKVQQNLAENFNIIWYNFEQKHSHNKSPLNTDLSILDLSIWINIKDKKVNLITL